MMKTYHYTKHFTDGPKAGQITEAAGIFLDRQCFLNWAKETNVANIMAEHDFFVVVKGNQ